MPKLLIGQEIVDKARALQKAIEAGDEVEASNRAFELLANFLVDIHRIADALEEKR
jgi:hypothetical protein